MKAIISAAGTGGHINPGIAIANKIMKEEPESKIIFIGTDRGLETDLVPRAGYELKKIDAHGIERKISIQNIKNLYATFKSINVAKKILEDEKPDVVIGTGGYICVPVMLSALKLKIPIVLHESNAFPGIAVKIFKKKANKILVGFTEAKERLGKLNNVEVTGNPIKIKKLNLNIEEKNKILSNMGLNANMSTVLVFGGSQGAQTINRSLIELIVNKRNKNYQIIWAVGQEQYIKIKQKLQEVKIDINDINNVKILPYIYNMEEIMNACDLVVCRSGAMTITEIACTEKPAIFIPYPYAAENHQEYNAKVLENAGAAKIILDKDLNSELLGNTILELIKNKSKLKKMSENASKIYIPNVEEKIYNELKTIIANNK